jgi:acetyl-CoA C-acetyltransferase
MKQPAAVLGVGQTRHRSKRTDVSIAGLCREAADRAVLDAGLTLADVDAVVVGKAPDLFEGVMMPELYLADALGAVGKPLLRVHTAGSVGGATGLVAASLVQAGVHRRVLAVAFEKQSESNAMWALSIAPPFSIPVVAGAGGYFAPHIRAYIRRSGAPAHIGAMVAVKDRRNGALNPYAHLQQAGITLESVQASPMLWDPVRYDETCPSSDGACAVVIGDSDAAAAAPGPVAWIRATAMRSEPTMFAGKDHVNPQAGRDAAAALWRQAGITDPLNQIDVAEIYVPFSWYEPMWLENLGFTAPGEGWRLTEAGETELGGRLPVNPPGGVLSSNPIGASGLLRFAESALQVMGKAGAHQVEGARTALGHAYGGGSQFFARLDLLIAQHGIAGSGALEHRDRGGPADDLVRRRVRALGLEQLPLLRVVEEGEHPVRDGVARGLIARHRQHQHEEAELIVGQTVPVDLGVDQLGDDVVFGAAAPFLGHGHAVAEDLGGGYLADALLPRRAVVIADHLVGPGEDLAPVLLRHADQLADRLQRQFAGDVRDELAGA